MEVKINTFLDLIRFYFYYIHRASDKALIEMEFIMSHKYLKIAPIEDKS